MKRREPAKCFQDLIVWQKAHKFVLEIYKSTANFPKEERYGLASQFRRAGYSIAGNIVEGFRKQTAPDKARFLNISEGSLEECRYCLILAHDLDYLNKEIMWKMSEEVGRLLNAYRRAILGDR